MCLLGAHFLENSFLDYNFGTILKRKKFVTPRVQILPIKTSPLLNEREYPPLRFGLQNFILYWIPQNLGSKLLKQAEVFYGLRKTNPGFQAKINFSRPARKTPSQPRKSQADSWPVYLLTRFFRLLSIMSSATLWTYWQAFFHFLPSLVSE